MEKDYLIQSIETIEKHLSEKIDSSFKSLNEKLDNFTAHFNTEIKSIKKELSDVVKDINKYGLQETNNWRKNVQDIFSIDELKNLKVHVHSADKFINQTQTVYNFIFLLLSILAMLSSILLPIIFSK